MRELSNRQGHFWKDYVSCLSISRRHTQARSELSGGSFTTLTGHLKAASKLKPAHPFPRFHGSKTGLFRRTGPGKPMEMASYFQSATSFRTPTIVRFGVKAGPESNSRCAFRPVARTFTWVPPISITSTFMVGFTTLRVASAHGSWNRSLHSLGPFDTRRRRFSVEEVST
jgi:hypothetical protein